MINQSGDFGAFVSLLKQGDVNACNALLEHISIIMNQWCQKNKLELSWTTLSVKDESEKAIAHWVYNEFMATLHQNHTACNSYSEYKKKVIEIAGRMIAEGFKKFNDLLISGNNDAWKSINDKLKIYFAKWFYNRQLYLEGEPEDLFSSAIAVLFEKVSSKELQFTDSCGLKSYFFRILENKAMETNRKQAAFFKFQNELPDESYVSSMQDDKDELFLTIQNRIRELSEIEQHILIHYFWNEKKLNEIAEELRISFENCRVIKHRAIQKIAKSITVR